MGFDEQIFLNMKKKLYMMDSFIETLLDEVGDAVYYQDKDLTYRFFNEAYLETVEKTAEEVYGHDIYNLFPKEDAEVYHADDLYVLKEGVRKSYEAVLEQEGKPKKIIEVIKRPHISDQGEILGIFGIIKDITALRENQKQLFMLDRVKKVFLDINRNILNYKSEREFFDDIQMEIQSVFDKSQQSSVLYIDDNREIRILVYRGYIHQEVADFHMPLTESYFYKHNQGKFDEAFYVNSIQEYIGQTSIPVITPEGHKSVQASLCIPLVVDNELKYIISIDSINKDVYDLTDKIVAEFISKELPIIYRIFELHKETRKLSKYDELTGLYNRRSFNQVSDQEISKLNKDQSFSMVIIDLDKLKRVNDRYGHLAGDLYIKSFVEEVAKLNNKQIRFGRIGGDEFAGYFIGYEYDDVEELMDTIQTNFANRVIEFQDISFQGSFSYGIAEWGADGSDRTGLMKVSDLRMYKNKHEK